MYVTNMMRVVEPTRARAPRARDPRTARNADVRPAPGKLLAVAPLNVRSASEFRQRGCKTTEGAGETMKDNQRLTLDALREELKKQDAALAQVTERILNAASGDREVAVDSADPEALDELAQRAAGTLGLGHI